MKVSILEWRLWLPASYILDSWQLTEGSIIPSSAWSCLTLLSFSLGCVCTQKLSHNIMTSGLFPLSLWNWHRLHWAISVDILSTYGIWYLQSMCFRMLYIEKDTVVPFRGRSIARPCNVGCHRPQLQIRYCHVTYESETGHIHAHL